MKHVIVSSYVRTKLLIKGIHGPSNASILPAMPYLVRYFRKRNIVAAEVGTRYGESSEMLLKSLNIGRYFVIDPYETYLDYQQDGFFADLARIGGDDIFIQTQSKLIKLNENITFLRCYSHDADVAETISLSSLDLVFIDGNHEFDYVLRDLRNFWKLLRPGGVLVGDEFHLNSKESQEENPGRPMVFEAVEQFATEIEHDYLSFGSHGGLPKTFIFVKAMTDK